MYHYLDFIFGNVEIHKMKPYLDGCLLCRSSNVDFIFCHVSVYFLHISWNSDGDLNNHHYAFDKVYSEIMRQIIVIYYSNI